MEQAFGHGSAEQASPQLLAEALQAAVAAQVAGVHDALAAQPLPVVVDAFQSAAAVHSAQVCAAAQLGRRSCAGGGWAGPNSAGNAEPGAST